MSLRGRLVAIDRTAARCRVGKILQPRSGRLYPRLCRL